MNKITATLALLLASFSALGADFGVQGKVTRLEPTFADHLNIKIDTAAGLCSAGTWLMFYGAGATDIDKRESIKNVYAGLLTSMVAGKQIAFYGNDQGCTITQLHLLNE